MTRQLSACIRWQGTEPATAALATFVAGAQLMLDAATPEDLRRQAETRTLAQLPVLRALGVFELFAVRDPALAALLRDELEQLERRSSKEMTGWHREVRTRQA
ncbi:MAG TPA: hypothetical protein VF269_06710 [Rhodanobacteraceae bacterium]